MFPSRTWKRGENFPTHFMRLPLSWQKTNQRYYKEKKLSTNILNEHRWKDTQLNIIKVRMVQYLKTININPNFNQVHKKKIIYDHLSRGREKDNI